MGAYIGYTVPHPEEPVMVFKVAVGQAGADVRSVMQAGLREHVLPLLTALRDEWVDVSGLDKAKDRRGAPLEAVATRSSRGMAARIRNSLASGAV